MQAARRVTVPDRPSQEPRLHHRPARALRDGARARVRPDWSAVAIGVGVAATVLARRAA